MPWKALAGVVACLLCCTHCAGPPGAAGCAACRDTESPAPRSSRGNRTAARRPPPGGQRPVARPSQREPLCHRPCTCGQKASLNGRRIGGVLLVDMNLSARRVLSSVLQSTRTRNTQSRLALHEQMAPRHHEPNMSCSVCWCQHKASLSWPRAGGHVQRLAQPTTGQLSSGTREATAHSGSPAKSLHTCKCAVAKYSTTSGCFSSLTRSPLTTRAPPSDACNGRSGT